MTSNEHDPPLADDDFPEFADAPLQKPRKVTKAKAEEPVESGQSSVDDVIARIKRERAAGKR